MGETTSAREDDAAQVAIISSGDCNVSDLLLATPPENTFNDFHIQQQKNPELQKLRLCVESGILPPDE